jgi:hypothetical protein
VVDEVRFVRSGDLPFRGLAGSQESLEVVKPELRHAVEIIMTLIFGEDKAVTLDQLAQSRNSSADWAMDFFPIMKELLVRQAGLLRYAINELNHGFLPWRKSDAPQTKHRVGSIIGVLWSMRKADPTLAAASFYDCPLGNGIHFREEPDDEEEEEDEDNAGEDDDDDNGDGYSE